MATVPDTSTTLLRDLAGAPGHARWSEFFARYETMMRSYLVARFPDVEADDVLQETMCALVRILPNYRYDPERHGFFHDYLTGILRNKALDALRKRERTRKLEKAAVPDPAGRGGSPHERDRAEWEKTVFAVALREFLADAAITERRKQAFLRAGVRGEPRQRVADELGTSLNAVNLAVSRGVKYLREKVEELKRL